jgi:hypothetical protein
MKKIVSLFSFLIVAVVALTLTSSSAFAAGSITNVTGVVKDGNGNPDAGVDVTATCNGISHSTTSVANGSYQIIFSTADNCTTADTVSITGTKGGNSGGGSAQVHLQKNLGTVNLNFSVVNFSVPEFTTMLGFIAGITALGGYLALRKKRTV